MKVYEHQEYLRAFTSDCFPEYSFAGLLPCLYFSFQIRAEGLDQLEGAPKRLLLVQPAQQAAAFQMAGLQVQEVGSRQAKTRL